MNLNIKIGKEKNKNYIYDMEKYPNLLVTGLDDESKIDLVNNVIYQVIKNNDNSQIKIVAIDNKKVNFFPFDLSTHLMMPVVTDMEYVDEVLEGLLKEITLRKQDKTKIINKIILIISEFDDMMIDSEKRSINLLKKILMEGPEVGVYTVLSTLYLEDDEYKNNIYNHFNIIASFYDRSKSMFNKFKFLKSNDKSFYLKSMNKKINIRLNNIKLNDDDLERIVKIDN